MPKDYLQTKNELIQILIRLEEFAAKKDNKPAVSLLQESRKRLLKEQFTMVILGEFKRGKSTFINALLGDNLLPAAIVPLTAIPTVVYFGEQKSVGIILQDGTRKEVSIDNIADYVTEKGNPKNVKQIREVQISYPSAFLKQGVMLVDTPGVGSVYRHNTEAAYVYLPNSDLAIFIISIDAPLGKNELDFLRDVAKHASKMYYVLNKIDIAAPKDINEAIKFVRETLQANLGDGEYDLFPLSARQALLSRTGEAEPVLAEKSGIIELENVLTDFIQNQKGRLLLKSSATRAYRIINEMELELQIWHRAMNGSLENLDNRIKLLTAELDKLEQEREDSIYLLYKEIDRLSAEVGEDINEYRLAKTGELVILLEEFYAKESRGKSAKELVETMNAFKRELIQSVLNEKRQLMTIQLNKEFERVAIRFFARVEEIVDNMMDASADIFDVPLEKSASKEFILGAKKLYCRFEAQPSFIPSLETLTIFGLLPKIIIAGQLLKNARKKLDELFERNCGRMRYDLVEGLKESSRDVAGELRLRADAVSQGMRSVLQRARNERCLGEAECRDLAHAWRMDCAELYDIKVKVKKILGTL